MYSCSWPAYIDGHGQTVPPVDNTTMEGLAKHCNMWRTYADGYDIYDGHGTTANKHSLTTIINYWSRKYADYHNDPFMNIAGAGQWNDPGT